MSAYAKSFPTFGAYVKDRLPSAFLKFMVPAVTVATLITLAPLAGISLPLAFGLIGGWMAIKLGGSIIGSIGKKDMKRPGVTEITDAPVKVEGLSAREQERLEHVQKYLAALNAKYTPKEAVKILVIRADAVETKDFLYKMMSPAVVALGKYRYFIVPDHALRFFDQEKLESIYAHEMAHALRADSVTTAFLKFPLIGLKGLLAAPFFGAAILPTVGVFVATHFVLNMGRRMLSYYEESRADAFAARETGPVETANALGQLTSYATSEVLPLLASEFKKQPVKVASVLIRHGGDNVDIIGEKLIPLHPPEKKRVANALRQKKFDRANLG